MVEAKTHKSGLEKVNILGVSVAVTNMDEVLKIIRTRCEVLRAKRADERPFFIVTVNPEFVMLAREDAGFKRILNGADLAVADGVGLRLADRRVRVVPGRKIVQQLAASKLYRIFYLGAKEGVAKEMAERYGGMWDEGHTNVRVQDSEFRIQEERIINKINRYGPDILLVAYGAPWQERWIHRNLGKIKAKMVMGVGGTFDYLTGKAMLPPEWLSRAGLEWLWRLGHEPWRWKRQLNSMKFAWLVMIERVRRDLLGGFVA